MQVSEKLLVACAKCGTANRVPSERLADEPRCGQCRAALLDGAPVELDADGFDRFLSRNSLPVLVDFWAQWCGPCKAMAPAFARVAHEEKTRVRFAKIDTERVQPVAARFSGALDARSLSRWLAQELAS